MKWLNCTEIRLVLVVFVVAIVLSGGSANADFTFSTPTNLGPIVNSSSSDWPPSISADGLSLFFCSDRPGGYGNRDIWVSTRPTVSDPWGTPVNLGPTVNSSAWEALPSISSNGLSLFFESPRLGGQGGWDIWVSKRATTEDDWSEPVNLGPMVNSSSNDGTPGISADGLSLFFESTRPGRYGSFDILVTTRPTTDDDWSVPVNLGPTVNSSAWEGLPRISADGLSLFFQSDRPGGSGGTDLWVTTRANVSDPWEEAVNLGPTVNSSASDAPGSISADGSTLFFSSKRPSEYGDWDLWQVPIEPIVDLNVDGIVDADDMCIMVDHWGEDYSLCDIGPMPWGDGIVDVEDLIVLAEHLFEEPRLIAYWALDEAEGIVAYNSTADCDGNLIGGPVWQPDAGMVAGSLQFDGIDDYIITDSVLDPADGPFSVFAWIKGGAPGQAVLSQAGYASWLCTDPVEGNLMTELKASGRYNNGPMFSQAVISDGQWHHVGFVWDGLYRFLYVDGIEVAKDATAQNPPIPANGGLYIGAGKNLEAGTFFSGLIDDIRIYNRVVSP